MNKSSKIAEKDLILLFALETAPHTGWNNELITALTDKFGLVAITHLCPDGLSDLSRLFAARTDQKMLEAIAAVDFDSFKIRDRIAFGVRARLEALTPHKQAFRESFKYMMHPLRAGGAKRMTWHTADILWRAAGDTASDYNHYSKRILLSGVLASTTLFWLRDTSENHEKTWAFLDRRIENVLKIGKFIGKFKKAS